TVAGLLGRCAGHERAVDTHLHLADASTAEVALGIERGGFALTGGTGLAEVIGEATLTRLPFGPLDAGLTNRRVTVTVLFVPGIDQRAGRSSARHEHNT